MSLPVIIDAGPSLNFFGVGRQDLLIAAMKAISAELRIPEIVRSEVHGKSISDSRFTQAEPRLNRSIAAGDVQVLSDAQDLSGTLAERADAVRRRIAVKSRRVHDPLSPKDLGESMVIAHGQILQETGDNVFLIIDDDKAQSVAADLGLQILDTEAILIKAAKLGLVKDRGEMRKLWDKLRLMDGSLVPWTMTRQLTQKSIYGSEAEPPASPSTASETSTAR